MRPEPNRRWGSRAGTFAAPLLAAAISTVSLIPASATWAATLRGAVVDSTSGIPAEGVQVHAVPMAGAEPRGSGVGAVTDMGGRFTLRDLPAGDYVVLAWGIGVERRRAGPFTVADGESLDVTIGVAPSAIRMNPVVVTASRRSEKSSSAPASISVLDSRTISDRPVTTPAAHVRALAGVDVASKGINQASVVARGFSSAQSTALLALTDYRITSIPSLRYNLFHYLPTPDEDMERIEVLRGPAAALYGPNSDRGVLQILTRDPWTAPGFSGSYAGGTRGVSRVSMRQAGRIGSSWGYKLSGQYFRGDDWESVDPVEQENRAAAIAAGASPDTLRIGKRNFENEHGGGEAQLTWRPNDRVSVVAAAGYHLAVHDLEQTATGYVQVSDWGSSYFQLRATRGRLFAQAFVNASDAEETYFLRTGSPIVDHSRLWVAQVQHGADLGDRLRLSYGLDGQWTVPRTEGTIMGRHEESDEIRELGGYLHSTVRLRSDLEGVVALRADDHSRFENPVYSPRAALVLTPSARQSLRVTYNRAFGTPSTDDLFADLAVGSAGPYSVRVEGVPESGFSFLRDEQGNPYMRSPFTPGSAGGPGAYLPPDATLLWGVAVAIAQSWGYDLSAVAPPTASEVDSELKLLGPDEAFHPVSGVSDLDRLEPTITNAFELGYQALLRGRIRLAADVYHTRVENFIGHLRVITPNVFLEPETLTAYLEQQGVPQGEAEAVADSLSRTPLGTVTPREALDPTDLILAVRNFGTVSYWGSDLSVSVGISDRLTLGGTFSWVSRDLFRMVDGLEDLALNAPATKGSVETTYRNEGGGWWAAARVRAVSSFPVVSGVYSGTVGSYTLADLRCGIRVASAPATSLTVTAENVFDDRHQEFVGAPDVGRLLLARLGVGF